MLHQSLKLLYPVDDSSKGGAASHFRLSSFVLATLLAVPVLLMMMTGTNGQTPVFPDKIRGYKVHREKIELSTEAVSLNGENDGSAFVTVGEPKLKDMGLTGVTFELSADILSPKQSGKIEFLTFYEMRVNGISVEVEEYSHSFSIEKREQISIPEPAVIFLPTTGLAHAAWKEISDPQEKWQVTGRIFIFGRFRKFGIYHKRVIPVDINIIVKNPLIKQPLSGP